MKKLYDILKEARIVPKGTPSFGGGSSDHFNQINSIISKVIANIISNNNYYRNNMGVVEAMFEDRVLGPLVEKYIKSKMIETNAEIVRGDESDIITRANVSLLTDKELLEFVEDNKEVQLYLARLFWKSYLDSLDINDIRKLVSKYYGSDYENEFSYKDIEDLIYFKLANDHYGTDSFPDSESYFASNEFADYAQRELQKNIFEARIITNPMGTSLKRTDLVKKLQDYYDYDPEFFDGMDIMSRDEIDELSTDSVMVNLLAIDIADGNYVTPLLDYYKKYKKIYIDGKDYTEDFLDYVNNHTNIKLEGVSEARIVPVGGEKLKPPKGWEKWNKRSIDEYNENNYDEDAEEFGYDPYDPYGKLIEAYEAPMEGWDENHPDVIYIFKKINNKFNVMGNYAFGDYISEGEYNSLYEAQKRAVELMEELKKSWDDDEED